MSLRFIEAKHLTIFIEPEKLRAIAECMDRKRIRREAGAVVHEKPSDEADHYLDEMHTLSQEGGGLSVWFRLPEEEVSSVTGSGHDPAASEGGTPRRR